MEFGGPLELTGLEESDEGDLMGKTREENPEPEPLGRTSAHWIDRFKYLSIRAERIFLAVSRQLG